MRSNTQAMINTNAETEKSIKGSVIPVLERLHKEIKHKSKELAHGAQKAAKEVEKFRNNTQKHIELLGQQTASYDSAGGRLHGADDPYVVRRGVLHRLNAQVISENNHRNDLIAVQNNFQTFEAHVIEVLQQAMEAFTQLAGGQGEKTRALHNDMLGSVQRITPDFEWRNFTGRSADRLIDPNEPPRSVDSVQFPNMDHAATRSIIEGSLERKSRNKLSWGYSTSYYVVTPSKFLHEFKDSDNTRNDPKPELSIYLPDSVVGTPDGEKFHVKGKDKSKGIGSKLVGSAELNFKAHTAADAQKWYEAISSIVGSGNVVAPAISSTPTSPIQTPSPSTEDKKFLGEQTQQTQPNPPIVPVSGHQAQDSGVTSHAPAPAVAPAPEKTG